MSGIVGVGASYASYICTVLPGHWMKYIYHQVPCESVDARRRLCLNVLVGECAFSLHTLQICTVASIPPETYIYRQVTMQYRYSREYSAKMSSIGPYFSPVIHSRHARCHPYHRMQYIGYQATMQRQICQEMLRLNVLGR